MVGPLPTPRVGFGARVTSQLPFVSTALPCAPEGGTSNGTTRVPPQPRGAARPARPRGRRSGPGRGRGDGVRGPRLRRGRARPAVAQRPGSAGGRAGGRRLGVLHH